MFIYTEKDTECDKRIWNINLWYKTHQKYKNTFLKIQLFEKSQKEIIYYIWKFHNLYFVCFYFLIYFLHLLYIYIYIYIYSWGTNTLMRTVKKTLNIELKETRRHWEYVSWHTVPSRTLIIIYHDVLCPSDVLLDDCSRQVKPESSKVRSSLMSYLISDCRLL